MSEEDVLSTLFVGSLGPKAGSTANDLGNGVIAYVVGNVVDSDTVFQVEYRGRSTYLKNVVSTVSLEGWTLTPEIYEAEDAALMNDAVSSRACPHA